MAEGKDYSEYEFPTCLHKLAASMHMLEINPGNVTIQIPRDDWWKLQCALERTMPGFMRYDGRVPFVEMFQYLGFRFVPAKQG